MNKKIIIALVIIVVLAVAGYFLFMGNNQINYQAGVGEVNNNDQLNDTQLAGEAPINDTPDTDINLGTNYEIMYTDSGFSTSELKIKVGDTVTWKNQSSKGMWIASAMHPTHVIYSGTSLDEHCPDSDNNAFDACKGYQPGESWSFTFNKAGTWRYHDHLTTGKFGTIIVE